MTARQVFEGLLTELSKVNAPSMLLSDFNYFFNKALCQYVNKRYNVYDTNQQTTDDLRVLKATAILEPKKVTESDDGKLSEFLNKTNSSKLFDGTYEVNLPLDYLHMLNCICIYEVDSRYKCYDKGDRVQFAARRLTADSWSIIVNDFYNRPLPERPYYYIHNINTDSELPTNPISNSENLSSSTKGTDVSDNNKLPRTISLKGIANNSLVEREAGVRYGNPTNVRMEIRCG